MRAKSFILIGLILTLVWGVSPALAEETGTTPPRLSFVDGQVSFYRPGAPDWVEAQVNTPMAPGDQLYTGSPGNIELQIGSRAFVRGWANTQIGLENHDPDFIQFKVTSGYAAFDLRDLPRGNTVEVDTPNAAFTINNPGYYRVDVDGERTTFITRKGGSAVATPEGGQSLTIAPSEELILDGTTNPAVSAYAAPPLDVWDQWNYDRTNDLVEAVSARYVSPESYGTDDLDRYGTWRVVPTYGSVWIPSGVPAGWAPYSTGTWIMDPYYGWTWVDQAPWGWAPYHYGRWVQVSGYWAWAPGPVVARPVYAPALVAFVGGPGLSVSVSVGSPAPTVGWVALGWGEPCVPWWGRPGFIHRPWWGGWGGPHVVNDVVVHHNHIVHVDDIHYYHHMKAGRGVMAVHEKYFGRGPVHPIHVDRYDVRRVNLNQAVSRKHVTPASYVPDERKGHRPPQESFHRPVVATRRPHVDPKIYTHMQEGGKVRERVDSPMTRLVPGPKKGGAPTAVKRPTFGQGSDERPMVQRGPHNPPDMDQRNRPMETGPEKPGTDLPGARHDARDNLPVRIMNQDRQPVQEARPTPVLPGRPANTLSPRDGERLRPSRIAPSDQAPERRSLEDVRNGSKGPERFFQQRIEQAPQAAPGRPSHTAPGNIGAPQRTYPPRQEQPRMQPPSQRPAPGGSDQQRFFQQRIEQVPRMAPDSQPRNVPGNSGGPQRTYPPRQEQPRIAPNSPGSGGGQDQQRIFQQRKNQQTPNDNRSIQRNEYRPEKRSGGRAFREL